jgi:hypothetical protein
MPMDVDHVVRRVAPAPGQRPAAPCEPPRVDLAPLVHAITRELRAAVPAARIEALLRQLLEHEFRDARVVTFVPIFLQRAACEALRHELPPAQESTDA